MITKIKNYFTYRRNRKILKREMVNIAAYCAPTVTAALYSWTNLTDVVVNIVEELRETDRDELITTLVDRVATLLGTTNTRLVDILSYIAQLPLEDIQTIVAHAMVESNPEIPKDAE